MNQSPLIFDRALYRTRRQKLQVSSEAFSRLSNEIANRFIDRLSILKTNFKNCWQIGYDGKALFKLIEGGSIPCIKQLEMFVVSDFAICPEGLSNPYIPKENEDTCFLGRHASLAMTEKKRHLEERMRRGNPDVLKYFEYTICCDEEALPIGKETLDLIISPLGFQWVNDLKGVLLQCLYGLKPDGLMLAAFIGEDSLWELQSIFRQVEMTKYHGISNRFSPLISSKDAGGLLQSVGFSLPVVDKDRIILSYPNAATLLKDIKESGNANMLLNRQSPPLTKDFLQQVEDLYHKQFPLPEGGIQVTLDIIFMSGWCPSEKQQKALKPGSALYSLAEVL